LASESESAMSKADPEREGLLAQRSISSVFWFWGHCSADTAIKGCALSHVAFGHMKRPMRPEFTDRVTAYAFGVVARPV
jgi:hypothetical protein